MGGQTTPEEGATGIAPEDKSAREGPPELRLGDHSRPLVTNLPPPSNGGDASDARTHFDLGMRHYFAYHHEAAYGHFRRCLALAPDCALAHGMAALCHCPNYNFRGEAYYGSTDRAGGDEAVFPSQQSAAKHARLAAEKVDKLNRRHGRTAPRTLGEEDAGRGSRAISDVETEILSAIRTLTRHPGIRPQLAEESVGRPYVDALRRAHGRFPADVDVSCLFAESLMVLNAWSLYEYPGGRPLSDDVEEIQKVLEEALRVHPGHAGICHLYVHLCEMSSLPERALPACRALREDFPDAGHLIHMPTHIDVLVGDYETCVESNCSAILADEKMMKASPETAGVESFYFGYIAHNFHMLVYGAILGGMESIAMAKAHELNKYLQEELFVENPVLMAYLESYAALDIHIMVRFGRWKGILQIPLPRRPLVMLFRSASLHYARGLALANTGEIQEAVAEADRLDKLRADLSVEGRILHNNKVSDLLAVDASMLRGEIAYFSGQCDGAFSLLRKAVAQQDGLNYDEPWGKMQPVRHTLGGLLYEQGHYEEAEEVFRKDLELHPKNPWGLVGLIGCLNDRLHARRDGCSGKTKGCQGGGALVGEDREDLRLEMHSLSQLLTEQRKSKWADFDISVPCVCCKKSLPS